MSGVRGVAYLRAFGVLVPRACSVCGGWHLALSFAPVAAPCGACLRAVSRKSMHQAGSTPAPGSEKVTASGFDSRTVHKSAS